MERFRSGRCPRPLIKGHLSLMRLTTLLAALAALAFSTTIATADAPRLAAQKCAVKTNAPGNYYISNAPGLPSVLPGPNGSPNGAAAINDCLTDAYAVQYGSTNGVAVAAAAAGTATSESGGRLNCARILNRSPGAAATYAVGWSLVAGLVGAGGQAAVYQNNLNKCLAANSGLPVNPNAAIYTGCSRRNGVMNGGTRLCVAP